MKGLEASVNFGRKEIRRFRRQTEAGSSLSSSVCLGKRPISKAGMAPALQENGRVWVPEELKYFKMAWSQLLSLELGIKISRVPWSVRLASLSLREVLWWLLRTLQLSSGIN